MWRRDCFQNSDVQSRWILGDVGEGLCLSGCIFVSSQAIFLIIGLLAKGLMVKDCLALTVDDDSAVIASKMLIFDLRVFWEVCGSARA